MPTPVKNEHAGDRASLIKFSGSKNSKKWMEDRGRTMCTLGDTSCDSSGISELEKPHRAILFQEARHCLVRGLAL